MTFLPSVQYLAGICKQITVLIHPLLTWKQVTLLKFTYASLQVFGTFVLNETRVFKSTNMVIA